MNRVSVFFVLCAVGGLITGLMGAIAGWSDGTTFTVGIVAMSIFMLAAFPFLDPGRTGSPRSKRR